MPFHSHSMLFLLVTGRAHRMGTCPLLSAPFGLRSPRAKPRWVPQSTGGGRFTDSVPGSISELIYHQDTGLVWIKGETFGRGSAKGTVRKNLLRNLGQILALPWDLRRTEKGGIWENIFSPKESVYTHVWMGT